MKISFISRLSIYTLSSGHRLWYAAEQRPFKKLIKVMSFLPFWTTKKKDKKKERKQARKKERKKGRKESGLKKNNCLLLRNRRMFRLWMLASS